MKNSVTSVAASSTKVNLGDGLTITCTVEGKSDIIKFRNSLYSTSTRPGEGAIYRYLSRQGKIAGDIHETKSRGLSLS